MKKSAYDVLGVDPKADKATIKRAYRRKAQEAHPDQPGGSAAAFVELNNAYGLLTDARRRAHYDATGAEGEAKVDNLTAEAANLLDALLMTVVSSTLSSAANPDTFDMLASINATTQSKIAQFIAERDASKRILAQIERMRKRIKFRGKGVNLFDQVMKNRALLVGNFVVTMERAIEVHSKALQMLQDYGYDTTPDGPIGGWKSIYGAQSLTRGPLFSDIQTS